MKKIMLLALIFVSASQLAHAQGCVVTRNIAGFGQYNLLDRSFTKSDWQLTVTNRYFEAKDVYTGTNQQYVPPAAQTFLATYTLDLGITRLLNKGWSITMSVPVSSSSRQSAGEHSGITYPKHTTHSFGLNDIRITAYKWILKPHENQKFNFQLGLGIKLPTGAYNYEDYFYRNADTTRILAPVNLTLQLGDGGTGITTELNAFYVFSKVFSAYGNFYYMANPRDQNGVSPFLGNPPSAIAIKTGATVTSVVDQYSMRAGASATLGKWVISAGVREDGVPVYDLLGQSNGLRRAGNNVSIEPGVMYNLKTVSIYAFVPYYFSHSDKQIDPDRQASEITGTYVPTSGGAGNYSVIIGAAFRL